MNNLKKIEQHYLLGFWVQVKTFSIVGSTKCVFFLRLLAWSFNVYNNFPSLSKTIDFFWFGALDKSYHSSCVLCVGMVAQKSCVLVNSCSSSSRLFSMMICGNFWSLVLILGQFIPFLVEFVFFLVIQLLSFATFFMVLFVPLHGNNFHF